MNRSAHGEVGGEAVAWDVARQLAHGAVAALTAEPVSLSDAVGRTLARDIIAAQDIPHYASSAMDGWAAHGSPPWRILPAGVVLQPGEATTVVTGGTIPPGADRIVRSEHGRLDAGSLHVVDGRPTPVAGADIRPAAEEARSGEILVAAPAILNPAHIAVAAACALDRLEVTIRPRVALLLTGDEVIESGLPTAGTVRDSFGPVLPALVRMLGGTVVSLERIGDAPQDTVHALREVDADLIITTGGTGSSSADHIRGALDQLGADYLVRRLAVRPGGPSLLARLPDGRMVAGLAGNPLAAITGLIVLVAPLLTAWSGNRLAGLTEVTVAEASPGHDRMTLLTPWHSPRGHATASTWTGAGMMRGLAESRGLLVIPPGGLAAGATATSLRLPWQLG